MPKRPGIYRITNLVSGKVYIGSSAHAPRRMWYHRWMLRRDGHDNVHLQRAWATDGEAAFLFEIVEDCPAEILLVREQAWIDATGAAGERGYNFAPVAGTRAGVPQPASVGEKMRAVHKGKPKSAEHRAKISAARMGQRKSPETIEKLRAAAERQFADPEARARAAEYGRRGGGAFLGHTHTPEVRAQISAARKANPLPRGANGTFKPKP